MNEKAFATQAPPSGTPENAPVSATYSSAATALTSSLITFQTVNATSMQKYDIKGLSNYSFWGTTDPVFVGNSFANTWKWQSDKSRITIAKLFTVTPGSYVTFVIAKVKLSSNTKYVGIIIRYDNGSNEIASGRDINVGY